MFQKKVIEIMVEEKEKRIQKYLRNIKNFGKQKREGKK
jgi:hypothetical protein